MKNSRQRRNLRIFAVSALISAGLCLALWLRYPDPQHWIDLGEAFFAFLKAHPLALLIALATLPGIGFPISPILILFGIVMGPRIGLPAACALGILAQSICSTWTYLLASGPLREWLKRVVLRQRRLPDFTPANAVRIGLLLRLTPGIPYALQNVALGVIGLPFLTYLLVSIPIQSLYTVGFIVTGGAIFEGRAGLALTGVLLIIVLIIATRLYLSHRRPHG